MRDEQGQTMAEYALVLCLVVLVAVAAVGSIGGAALALLRSAVGVFP